jgi:hypothetical protein
MTDKALSILNRKIDDRKIFHFMWFMIIQHFKNVQWLNISIFRAFWNIYLYCSTFSQHHYRFRSLIIGTYPREYTMLGFHYARLTSTVHSHNWVFILEHFDSLHIYITNGKWSACIFNNFLSIYSTLTGWLTCIVLSVVFYERKLTICHSLCLNCTSHHNQWISGLCPLSTILRN